MTLLFWYLGQIYFWDGVIRVYNEWKPVDNRILVFRSSRLVKLEVHFFRVLPFTEFLVAKFSALMLLPVAAFSKCHHLPSIEYPLSCNARPETCPTPFLAGPCSCQPLTLRLRAIIIQSLAPRFSLIFVSFTIFLLSLRDWWT